MRGRPVLDADKNILIEVGTPGMHESGYKNHLNMVHSPIVLESMVEELKKIMN